MDTSNYFLKVDDAAAFLEGKIKSRPKIALVLSGGLSSFIDRTKVETTISSKDIPNFPVAKTEGHSGSLVFAKFGDTPIVAMIGRFHYYEGHSPASIVFPHFVLNKLGVNTLITTNAVGGINKTFKPGDIMMVTDHINMMGFNPLIGIATQRKTDQFTSLVEAYDKGLMAVARKAAKAIKLDLKEGIYVATSGPSYETKAEISAFRNMAADAVGMSTVPEVIAANFLKMRVLSFSCIANAATDLHEGEMRHSEVLEAMNALAPKAVNLLAGIVGELV